jgi:Na+-transporting NADH:ubiquinone oxidoreductase subunit B
MNMGGKLQIQKGMMQVCYALAPCALASVYLFGWRALAILAVTLIVGIGTEALFTLREGKPVTSAKMAFGGFGRNIFNPAMAGRCFLYVTFPVQMTNRWAEPLAGGAAGFASWTVPPDAVTRSTPLGALRAGESLPLSDLFFGFTGGSLGETSALLVLLGGIYLLVRKVAPWRIALSCLAGGLAVSVAAGALGHPAIPGPLATLLSGSFLFGTMFVATEPISGARTREGQLIYGFFIGALTVVLRGFSNFPEGIMFSVLMMNAAVPLLDRGVQSIKKAVAAPARETA